MKHATCLQEANLGGVNNGQTIKNGARMMDTALLKRRFEELELQMLEIEKTRKHHSSNYSVDYDSVDADRLLGWQVKAKNLISTACGKESEHYSAFQTTEKVEAYGDSWQVCQRGKAVFLAAKEDFEGGYITSVRVIIQAEVYDSELDQASGLLNAGYPTPAAVVAGVVLETAIRQLCVNRGIATGKLDKMNADLAKSNLYSLLIQKKITALADIRNNAAHGHPTKFNKDDVEDMIRQVERFVADYPE
jgi:hypothetical protein